MNLEPDTVLVRRAQRGDTAAFDTLVRRHERRIYLIAIGIVRTPHDAADVTQEALIAAYRHLGSFEARSSFTTWLHRITLRKSYDHLRRSTLTPIDPYSSPARDQPDPLADPSTAIVQSDILGALASLDPTYRDAVLLVDVAGVTIAEAAETLDTAEGTIKSRVFRGRAALAAALGTLGYGESSNE